MSALADNIPDRIFCFADPASQCCLGVKFNIMKYLYLNSIVKKNAFIRCTMKEKIFYNQICVINGKIDCQKIRTKKKIIPNEEQSYLLCRGNSFLASAIHKNCDIISR